MEHLPNGVKDEAGCFVYQVVCNEGVCVRSAPNVGDEVRTPNNFSRGDLVSIDGVRTSRVAGSQNGPFLRLSDGTGWLFEKKQGECMMKKMPVSVGLWTFFVDNAPFGIGLRRHPMDRQDVRMPNVAYETMQKIHCDRKMQHPSNGINFYRVQGTEGWVFDRRLKNGDDCGFILLDESLVEIGLFVYECIDVDSTSIGIRETPEIGDDNRIDLSVEPGQLISANLIRKSPYPHGNGPFLRLSDGSGWLFEKKRNLQLMRRLIIQKGEWELCVSNPVGIRLRRQPIDSQTKFGSNVVYKAGTILRCTHMVQASSGVKFYRVENADGWVFDRRDEHPMLMLQSEQPPPPNGSKGSIAYSLTGHSVFSNPEDDTGWSPDFVRGVAASIDGITEVAFNEQSRVISFRSAASDGIRINVYYTTQTIGTRVAHPTQGATQLFRRNCTTEDLKNIFTNPRVHTGKGYKRRRNDPSANLSSEIVETPYERGIEVDQEVEDRTALLELDEEIAAMLRKRDYLLKRIRRVDLCRADQAQEMKAKIDARTKEHMKRQRERQAQKELEEQEARDLQNRTCQVCGRVFLNSHAKQQHYNALHVYRCGYCYKEFSSQHSLNQHCDALGHW